MNAINSKDYTINYNKTDNGFIGKDGNEYVEYQYSVEFHNLPLENYTHTNSYDINDDVAYLIEDAVSADVSFYRKEQEIKNMPSEEYIALYIDEDGNDTRY